MFIRHKEKKILTLFIKKCEEILDIFNLVLAYTLADVGVSCKTIQSKIYAHF